MIEPEPENLDILIASAEWSKAFLAERSVTFDDSEETGYNDLMAELQRRSWRSKYMSGGWGFQVSARKAWYPSTFFELVRIEGRTLTEGFVRVVTEAIQKDDEMGNRQVGSQFPDPWQGAKESASWSPSPPSTSLSASPLVIVISGAPFPGAQAGDLGEW